MTTKTTKPDGNPYDSTDGIQDYNPFATQMQPTQMTLPEDNLCEDLDGIAIGIIFKTSFQKHSCNVSTLSNCRLPYV
jgi:hypothetical protein